ncbi:MAG: hypothetical protein ACREXK_07205 [Gammaproteobacteria bacterium]
MHWWKSYWFRPAPLLDLAVLRITAVGLQLWLMVSSETIGLDDVKRNAGMPDSTYWPLISLRLVLLPFGWGYRPPEDVLVALWWLTLVCGVLAFIGFRSNANLVVFAIGSFVINAYIYSFGDLHHRQAVMLMALAVLALSPAGRVLSVDAWWAARNPATVGTAPSGLLGARDEFARWPILLLQWFFVLMYFSAFVSKIIMNGPEWINGYTLQYYLMRDGLRFDSAFGLWFAQFHELIKFSQWVVIIFQATFWVAVLFPVTRWVYVPLGLGMHIFILLTMKADFYQWMALYVVFIPWTELFRRLSQRSRERTAEYA